MIVIVDATCRQTNYSCTVKTSSVLSQNCEQKLYLLDSAANSAIGYKFNLRILQVSHSAVQTLPSLFLSLGRQIERERGFEEVKY